MAAPRRPPDDLPGVIAVARSARGWSQAQLARAAGLSKTSISEYERGRVPSLPSLQRIAEALGATVSNLVELAAALRRFRDGRPGIGTAASRQEPGATPALSDLEQEIVEILLAEVEPAGDPRRARLEEDFAQARIRAPALWQRLEGLPGEARRRLVRRQPEFQDAALCELLCELSVEAAGDDVSRAIDLAELAVLVARRSPDPTGMRRRLEGYAGFHLANTRRVSGSPRRADALMERAAEQWRSGAAADPGLLNEARVLELEASLRRDQRRLPEAIAILDRALAVDRWGETPALLIGKAKAVEEAGEFEHALGLLERAASLLDPGREPRRLFIVANNRAVNLCHLGCYAEAERLLPEIRSRGATLGPDLDLLRVDWLEGKVAAGLGHPDEAIAILRRVRDRFVERGIAYDAALVTLELAEVHASQGRTAEVKALARESAPIFRAEGVHREARAALALFRQAARREAVTAGLLRRLILYLYRARQNPDLRFDA